MANPTSQVWQESFDRKSAELDKALSRLQSGQKHMQKTSLTQYKQIQSWDDFEASLQRLCSQYASRGLTRFVQQKMQPRVEQIKAFSSAVTAASQANMFAALTWGGLLMVIESSAIFARSLDETFDQLEKLHSRMPLFHQYVVLYENHAELRYALRDVYEDYIDYCIAVIRFIRINPFARYLSAFKSVTPHTSMSKAIKRMDQHVQQFDRTVELVDRQQQFHSNKQVLTLVQPQQRPSPTFPVSTVDQMRNSNFSGRVQTLDDLQRRLVITSGHGHGKPISCALEGIAGVGKTQTATEFAHRYGSSYSCRFWIRSETEVEILASFGAIGRALLLFDDDENTPAKAERVLRELHAMDQCWLVIFDNVRDWKSIQRYWPHSCKDRGSILVTSQNSCPWIDFPMRLEPLPPKEGSSLLLKQLGRPDDDPERPIAEKISRIKGGLPLELAQAAGFVDLSKLSLGDCLQRIQSSSKSLGDGNLDWQYLKDPRHCWDDAIDQLSDDAKALLFLLAFLNPDQVSEKLLLSEQAMQTLRLHDSRKYQSQHIDAVASLVKGRLVERQPGLVRKTSAYLSTHRSLQEGILQRLGRTEASGGPSPARQDAFQRAVALLRGELPRASKLQQANAMHWAVIQTVLPHLQSLEAAFRRAEPPLTGSLEFAELLADTGMEMYDHYLADDAWDLLRTSIQTLDTLGMSQQHPLRGDILIILGLLTDTLGISAREEGLEYRDEALEIRAEEFSRIPEGKATVDDAIRLHNCYTDLACSYQQLNDFDKVEELCSKCFIQYKQWGTEDEYPYEYAKYYHHMAFVHVYQHNPARGLEFAKRAADLMASGNPGAEIATAYRFDWATIRFQLGERQEAIAEHVKIFEKRVQDYTLHSTLTRQSCLIIGVMHYMENEFDQAESWLRKSLVDPESASWPVENVARAKHYLSQSIGKRSSTRPPEALKLEQEAADIVKTLTRRDGSKILNATFSDSSIMHDYLAPWGYRVSVVKKAIT